MSSLLLKLCVLTVVLSVVLATSSLERERRASKFNRLFGKIGGGIKTAATKVGGGIKTAATKVGGGIKNVAVGYYRFLAGGGVAGTAIRWMFPATFKVADTVDEEAEIVLSETDKTINKGQELVTDGERLLQKATELEVSLGNDVGKRAAGGDAKGIRELLQAIKDIAQRSIKAGQKVIGNSEKISAALRDAVSDISKVVADGVADVGAAVADVGESIAKIGLQLESAKASADNTNQGLGDAIDELENTGRKVVEAGKSFEEVGRRSLTLLQRILKLGKNIVQVIGKAAKNIVKASGITGRK